MGQTVTAEPGSIAHRGGIVSASESPRLVSVKLNPIGRAQTLLFGDLPSHTHLAAGDQVVLSDMSRWDGVDRLHIE